MVSSSDVAGGSADVRDQRMLNKQDDNNTMPTAKAAVKRALTTKQPIQYFDMHGCKFATIVIRLDPSLSKAHWVLSSDDSCPLDFLTIVPGFLIHNSTLPAFDSVVMT